MSKTNEDWGPAGQTDWTRGTKRQDCTYCGQPEHECSCKRTMNDQLADYDQIVGNV